MAVTYGPIKKLTSSQIASRLNQKPNTEVGGRFIGNTTATTPRTTLVKPDNAGQVLPQVQNPSRPSGGQSVSIQPIQQTEGAKASYQTSTTTTSTQSTPVQSISSPVTYRQNQSTITLVPMSGDPTSYYDDRFRNMPLVQQARDRVGFDVRQQADERRLAEIRRRLQTASMEDPSVVAGRKLGQSINFEEEDPFIVAGRQGRSPSEAEVAGFSERQSIRSGGAVSLEQLEKYTGITPSQYQKDLEKYNLQQKSVKLTGMTEQQQKEYVRTPEGMKLTDELSLTRRRADFEARVPVGTTKSVKELGESFVLGLEKASPTLLATALPLGFGFGLGTKAVIGLSATKTAGTLGISGILGATPTIAGVGLLTVGTVVTGKQLEQEYKNPTSTFGISDILAKTVGEVGLFYGGYKGAEAIFKPTLQQPKTSLFARFKEGKSKPDDILGGLNRAREFDFRKAFDEARKPVVPSRPTDISVIPNIITPRVVIPTPKPTTPTPKPSSPSSPLPSVTAPSVVPPTTGSSASAGRGNFDLIDFAKPSGKGRFKQVYYEFFESTGTSGGLPVRQAGFPKVSDVYTRELFFEPLRTRETKLVDGKYVTKESVKLDTNSPLEVLYPRTPEPLPLKIRDRVVEMGEIKLGDKTLRVVNFEKLSSDYGRYSSPRRGDTFNILKENYFKTYEVKPVEPGQQGSKFPTGSEGELFLNRRSTELEKPKPTFFSEISMRVIEKDYPFLSEVGGTGGSRFDRGGVGDLLGTDFMGTGTKVKSPRIKPIESEVSILDPSLTKPSSKVGGRSRSKPELVYEELSKGISKDRTSLLSKTLGISDSISDAFPDSIPQVRARVITESISTPTTFVDVLAVPDVISPTQTIPDIRIPRTPGGSERFEEFGRGFTGRGAGFIPLLPGLGGVGGRRGRRKKPIGKVKTKYQADLSAVIFNIRANKIPTRKLTGLETRPLVGKMKWVEI